MRCHNVPNKRMSFHTGFSFFNPYYLLFYRYVSNIIGPQWRAVLSSDDRKRRQLFLIPVVGSFIIPQQLGYF